MGVVLGMVIEISAELVANNPRLIYVSVQEPFCGQPVNSLFDLFGVNSCAVVVN